MKVKRRIWAWVLAVLAAFSLVVGTAIPAFAAAGSTPAHTKLLTDNHDGTYTLSLDVVGESERKPNPVNVIVILDHSGSMDERTGGYGSQTRMDAAQNAVNNLARSLFNYNTSEFPELVEMALVGFSTTGSVTQAPTTSYNTFSGAVNGLDADGGTNWEDALQDAAGINFGDQDPTYVIFVSDGNPTFRMTSGSYDRYYNDYYLDGWGRQQYGRIDDQSWLSSGVYGNGQDITTENVRRSYNEAVDDARSLATTIGADHFYTIGAYGNVDRMQSLTTAAGAPAGNYFSAANTTDLQNALAAILAQIEKAGIGSVEIEDGTTNQVTASSGVVELLEVDTSSFKYYKDGAAWADAPKAQFVDGAVEWDLSSVGVLDDGVKYTVTFDCYPSQYTYDTIAQLKNGDIKYSELDPEVQKYIVDNGNGTYSLRTNTAATLDWDDTRTDDDEKAVAYTNPDPVRTDAATMSVSKEWENTLDARTVGSIDMTVLMGTTEFHKVTLTDPEWSVENIYISPGIIKNGQVLPGAEGHDFTFAELGSEQYNWELVSPVVHPMLINGTLTMLTLVDEAHPAPSGAQTYQINGKTYYSNGTSAASLDAYNYRRSNLNLTKVVTGEDAPKDATFPFTLTVNNSKASSGSASDTNSDYYVWFSIYDTNAGATVTNATVTGATGPSSSGYYYAPSGTAITVQMKAGWNLRFTNLPTGTTYTFAEGNLADGFAFNKAELTSGTDKDTSFSGGKTSTGTIQATNTSYVVTYTNDYELTDLEITKVWNDASNQDGIRPTAEEFAEMLTLDPAVEGAAPTVVDNGDDTYTITYTGLPRFNNGTEVEYTVAEGAIDGYTTEGSPAKDHETITNTHTPEVTNVTVIKEWANDDFTGNIRPASIQAQLKADGENSGTPVTLNAANEWTYTWEGLPKFKDGKEIVYTADETAVPTGYSKTVSDPVTTDEGVEITVTNTYAPESTTASFPVKKVVSVPEGLTGPATWSYTINVAANAGAPEAETMTGTVSNTADTATFGPITYTMPGTYTYTVSETGTVAGVTNDAEAAGKTVTVTVVANSDGTLTATADSTDANALTFTNTYAAEPTTASFPVEKILSVAEGLTAPDITGKYTIALAAVDGAPMPETTSYTNPDADGGTVTFGAITYTAPGTYAYTVTESGEVKGINNDSAATTGKTVTVTVTDNGDGTLTATPSSTADEPVSFTNTYEVGQATASIPVEKVVSVPEGLAGPTDWTYTATVTAKDGAPVAQTMTAELTKANPSASIGEITYTKPGTYKYTVTESGTVAGITNGTASYDIEVVVTDNSDGTLTAVVNGDKAVTFTNTYSVEPTTAKFPVVKDLVVPEGLEGPEDASWTVTLTGANNAPMPTTTTGTITSEEGATFGDITYTLPGTYTYTVTESGTVAGVTNDAEPAKTVTVTVVDNGNGTLTATPSATEEAPVTFTNTYSVEPTTANIPVEKVMSVPEGMTGPTQWSYTITAAANDGAPVAEQMSATVTNTQKTATIGEITYTKPGTYTYTVTESGTVAGVTNDAEAAGKTVTVTVVDNHDGTLTATVSATENEPVTFTNTYNAEPTTAEFPVKKILSVPEGLEGPTEWEYTINVEAQDDAPEAETMSGKVNKTTDTVTFGDFTFTKPGTYKYTVTETGTVAGVTNDPSTGKTVTIQVVDNHDGTMTATASATEDEPVTFTNTYKVDPTTAEFPVKKVLSVPAGQTGPASWTYTIDVKANDGAPAAETMTGTVTNTTDTVTFGDFTYEKPGTYTYTVTESGTVAGVTNDSEATTGKTVTVTVVDNHDGTLTATANSTAAKPLSFTNVYGVQPATAKFPVQKVLEVPETLDGPAEWSYTIDVTAEDGAPEASTMTGTVDQDNDTVTFGDFTYTEPGIYTYTVSETGTIDGVTNDAEAAGKTVTVTVVDNGDGTLTATADSTEEEPLQFTNTYSVEPTTAKFPVEKVMSVPEGVDGPKAWSYDIAVVANDDAPEAETMTGKVDQATTSVTFGDFTYTEPGTYTYTVSETGTVAGVTNDTEAAGKTVTVTVVDNGDGTLTATADSTTDSPLQFTNTYAAKGTVTPVATKVADGFTLEANQFTFQLKDADGELVDEAKNDANGNVTFGAIEYTATGEYKYTINELVIENDGIADDTHVCNVTVTVVDNGDGTLTATASYDNNKFVNTHDETQKDVVSAKDTEISVDGELVEAGDTLTYTITYANNTSGEATVTVTDTIPTNTTYVEGSASDGGEYADGVITWTIDKVPAGGTGTVTFQVTVDEAAAGTTIENTGNVDDGENKSSSNSVTTSVPVKDVKNGDTSIDGDGVQVGDTLTYEVSFTLTEDATSVVVTDDVPANTTLVDGSISEGGTVADGKITWDLGALTAGDYTVSFKVTVDESAVTVDAITNTASISVNNHSEVKTNTVTNNAEKGGLTITKTVTVPEGFEIDKDAVFTFTINLTDKNGVALEGEYAYTGSSEGTVTNGSTVTLKHGESITIAGLPAGAKYEIVESEASGYTPAQGTISGTIPEGDTASETAAFENAYSTEAAKLELKAAKLLKVKEPATNPPDVSGAYTIAIEGSKDAPMPATKSFKNADGNGTATSFGEISFTKPGEYQYTITEEGTVKGVENGTASYTVRVKVTDQKNGSLKAEIVEGEATTTFENTYSVTPVTLPTEDQFHVSKNLTGTPLSAGAFEFTLTGADGAPMPAKTEATNDADGNVTFDTITYAKPGTYTYTIAEKDGGKGGYTYDTNTVTVTVVVTDNGEGALEAVVSYSDDTEFDNSYAASGVVNLSAQKKLTGRGIEEGQFTFELVDENGKVLQTKTNNGSGSVQFDAIEYTEGIFDEKKADEATAEDKTTETEGTDTEITDQAVEAPVEDAAQAVDETEAVEAEAAPVETEAAEVATEVAEAEAAPAEVEAEPEAAEAEDDGISVSDIAGFISRNVFAPKVAWAEEAAELEAAEAGRTKTFTYTIREVNDGAAGYTYDTHVETVTVTVTDNDDGSLTAVEAYDEDGAVFTNAYEATGSVQFGGTKAIETETDRTLAEGEFTFQLKDADGNVVEEVKNAADGSFQFSALNYVQNADQKDADTGTFTYTIVEVNDGKDGFTYDSHVCDVTVTVTDNGDGTLACVAELSDGEAASFVNPYTPLATTIKLEATKQLTGRTLKAGEFTFELSDADGKVIATVKNAADGSINFGEIMFTEVGEYTFTAKEVKGTDANVTYDESVLTYVVTVVDNDGQLEATLEDGKDYVFKNKYTEPPSTPKRKKVLPQTSDDSMPTSVVIATGIAGASLVAAGLSLRLRKEED